MTIEERLKNHINSKYESVNDFCVRSGIPNSTLQTVFTRGITNTSSKTIFRVCDALSLDPYRNMASFHRPVLIIHGDQDGIVPIAYSYRAKETYPDVRLEVIQGADHGFNGADSIHAWELSRDFIKGMEKKGSVFSKIMNLRHLISISGKG